MWGVTLLSANSAKPSGYKQAPTVCNESWAGTCLDGSGLSSAGVKGIIAAGVIVIVGVLTGLCVWWDIRRRSHKVGVAFQAVLGGFSMWYWACRLLGS